MAKYQRKPDTVDAEEYKPGMEDSVGPMDKTPYIDTPDGTISIDEGDFIVTNDDGERYQCSPDAFHSMYEKVEELE